MAVFHDLSPSSFWLLAFGFLGDLWNVHAGCGLLGFCVVGLLQLSILENGLLFLLEPSEG